MRGNFRRWKAFSKRRGSLKTQPTTDKPVHERLYKSALKKKELIRNLKETQTKEKMKECTFKPKLNNKAKVVRYQEPEDDRAISAPMCRPSTSVFDKITGNIS